MAKLRPVRTLEEMEEDIGFRLDDLTNSSGRLYSDLSPVSSDIYERTEKEYEEFVRMKRAKGNSRTHLRPGESKTVEYNDDSVQLSYRRGTGSYRFLVDVRYGFGLSLAFLLSEAEATRMLSTAKFHGPNQASQGSISAFFSLPAEIRQKIYMFALPRGEWRILDNEKFERDNLPGGIGDPSGFYYPLSRDLAVLRINKQIRGEALPLAYRRTTFYLEGLESAIKFLVAIGQAGRDNIESLHLAWENTADSTYTWDIPPGPEQLDRTLPVLHTSTCIQLLKQCKRLRRLCLQLEGDLIQNMAPDMFMADPGIKALCSLRVKRVEISDLWSSISLEQRCEPARWLKEQMESMEEKDKDAKTFCTTAVQV